MSSYLKFSIAFILIAFSSFQGFTQGISMSPTRIFFTGAPGETVSKTVTIGNSSDSEYIFSVNMKDWHREETGNKVYFEVGSLKNSNAKWISTPETTVSVPPKSTIEVVVTMAIPETATAPVVTNSMLFFTQIGKQADKATQKDGIGIITLFEFGIHVYHTPDGNNNQSLDIISFNDEAATNMVSVGILNDGNVICDASVELELTNTSTGEEIKLEPINISMMPEAKQVVKFQLPKGLNGEYLGVTIVKMAGSNDLRVGEKTFEF